MARSFSVSPCPEAAPARRPGPASPPTRHPRGAVANLTKGMATDWAKYGLQVNALAPGYFATELNAALVADPAFSERLAKRTPAGRWGMVEELWAPASSWSATPRAS